MELRINQSAGGDVYQVYDMYVRSSSHIARVRINQVSLPILLVGS